MRIHLPASMVLACAIALPAQQNAYDKLVASYQTAANQDQDAAVVEFLPQFQHAADGHDGTEAAVPFLTWIVRNGRVSDPVRKALDTLVEHHSGSLALGPVLEVVPNLATYLGEDQCTKLIKRVLAAGSPPELHARALLARATMVMTRTTGVDAGARKAAAKDLETARKLTKDPTLIAALTQTDAKERGLTVGDRVPEVAGFDLDGLPLRLSDYRGKVVVVDFWGDW